MDYVDAGLYFEASDIANELCHEAAAYLSKPIERINCFDVKLYVEEIEEVEFIEVTFKKHLRKMMLGSTSKIAGETFISINAELMLERKNFTCMHEVIHYYRDIPYEKENHTFSDMIEENGYLPEDYPKEYRANVGAGILMANDEALQYALTKFDNFGKVANYFFISKAALFNRLRDYLVYIQNCSPSYAASLVTKYKYGQSKDFFQAFFK
ncbi:hypothetical protein IGI37_003140 [Enterococcus sp. AZ194]|uniref:ImmA/IrrE family metallo-endopeptidase n=1 Tax=Enterococcus sp. AZ194 TaxID=2774629 RepID=UPI003F1E866B